MGRNPRRFFRNFREQHRNKGQTKHRGFCFGFFGRIQNMDRGPWTTPWTLVHGPPLIFNRKSPLLRLKFTGGQGVKNKDSYLLLTSLTVCLMTAGQRLYAG